MATPNNLLLIPASPLVLYAKGWINFHVKHPDWNIERQAQEIISMCGYLRTSNPSMQILVIFDRIVKFVREYNDKVSLDRQVNIPYISDSLFSFENDVVSKQHLYSCTREEAIIRTIYEALMYLDIKPFVVDNLEYSKKRPYVLNSYHEGMTYKEMNQKFNKSFNDKILNFKFKSNVIQSID